MCQVLEFCDSDLEALIKAKGVVLSPGDIKAYMSMLLQALQACHQHWILHRDVKPNNMLISRDGAAPVVGEAVYGMCVGVVVAEEGSLHSKE
jgi:cyclin-dependent kinase 7